MLARHEGSVDLVRIADWAKVLFLAQPLAGRCHGRLHPFLFSLHVVDGVFQAFQLGFRDTLGILNENATNVKRTSSM